MDTPTYDRLHVGHFIAKHNKMCNLPYVMTTKTSRMRLTTRVYGITSLGAMPTCKPKQSAYFSGSNDSGAHPFFDPITVILTILLCIKIS